MLNKHIAESWIYVRAHTVNRGTYISYSIDQETEVCVIRISLLIKKHTQKTLAYL